jgi:rhodanese-related sulfurtransferase
MLDSMSDVPLEITPQEVKRRLDQGSPLRLIDVREPFEDQQAHLEGATLVPMRTIPAHLAELQDGVDPLVVLCHHGMRSLQVVMWLRQNGVPDCRSMSGGIDQWSREIDPTVPRYY